MSGQFGFIDIILLAMFAGFIILRLRNILGRKTGYQGKPTNRYFPKGMEVLKDIENNEAIRQGNVDEEAKKQFLKGADVAYEQIITSFAKGDKKQLKGLIAKGLFEDFSEVIDERKKKQHIPIHCCFDCAAGKIAGPYIYTRTRTYNLPYKHSVYLLTERTRFQKYID